MTTLKIRQKIFDYINDADDRILKAVYAMLKEYKSTPVSESMLSDEQYEEIEKRWKNYESGKSKSYSIEETRRIIKNKLRK